MRKLRTFLFSLACLALLLPGRARAAGFQDDKVIFGESFTLGDGEILNGDLAVIGGAVTLEAGSTVNGDVVLMGGSLDADGAINGDLVCAGGTLKLGGQAHVNGDVVIFGARLSQDPGAVILGNSLEYRHQHSYNLVITSPPYMNGLDYVMNYKIEMGWLEFADNHKQLKQVKDAMVVCDNVSKGLIKNFAVNNTFC